MYHKFETFITSEIYERAKGGDTQQETLRQLLVRAQNGDPCLGDWKRNNLIVLKI